MDSTQLLQVYKVFIHMKLSTQVISSRIPWKWLFYWAVTHWWRFLSPEAYIAEPWTHLACKVRHAAAALALELLLPCHPTAVYHYLLLAAATYAVIGATKVVEETWDSGYLPLACNLNLLTSLLRAVSLWGFCLDQKVTKHILPHSTGEGIY